MTAPVSFDRRNQLDRALEAGKTWDLIVIGGGATGLGTAVDAALRGYQVLLLEQDDFGAGTSSRSTKLVHGGVRYLAQGNVALVRRALVERGYLLKNAPHLVSPVPFIIPCYRWWERAWYGLGLGLYEALSGSRSLGGAERLDRETTRRRLPTIRADGLRGGVCYHDGQFDDARLALSLALTCADAGGVLLNYMKVVGLSVVDGRVGGVVAVNQESGSEHDFAGRVVVNATGVFADSVRRLETPDADAMVRPSQGIHLVLGREFLPGDSALMIPHTDDGRVLFAIPWNDRVLLGTTDTPVEEIELEARPLEAEIDYLLMHAGRYLARKPTRADVLSVFAGLRPLVSSDLSEPTRKVTRDHVIVVSRQGLVTVTGGKWTTYRHMADLVVTRAASTAGLPPRNSSTRHQRLHGWTRAQAGHSPPSMPGRPLIPGSPSIPGSPPETGRATMPGHLAMYGADAPAIRTLSQSVPEGASRLHPRLPFTHGQVVWAVRREMARTVADVLARRTRALILDARAAMDAAPLVAGIMARELGFGREWETRQVEEFLQVAAGYLPGLVGPGPNPA